MKMHPLTQAAVLAVSLFLVAIAAPVRAGERAENEAADSAAAETPRDGKRATASRVTWFDRAVSRVSLNDDGDDGGDNRKLGPSLTSGDSAETLATPTLGPLNDQPDVMLEGPLYEGPIVDLTDSVDAVPPT